MRIPHIQLSPTALRAVVEEFVTRDGTDHTSIEQRIELVLRQLDVGSVELHFEQETGTCNILPMSDGRNPRAGSAISDAQPFVRLDNDGKFRAFDQPGNDSMCATFTLTSEQLPMGAETAPGRG